jgi:hypothetical protein
MNKPMRAEVLKMGDRPLEKTLGSYPRKLSLASDAACDAIAPDSLAAAVTRRSVEIDQEDL